MGIDRFNLQNTLAATDVTRQNMYDLIEEINPLSALVETDHFTIVANEIALSLNAPRWVKIGDAKTHTDLQTSALVNDIELIALPAKGVVQATLLKHSVAFAGDFTELKLSVGITGALTKYLPPFDVMQAVGDEVFGFAHEWGAETHDSGGTSIRLAAEAVDGDLDTSTAGTVDVWMLYGAPQ